MKKIRTKAVIPLGSYSLFIFMAVLGLLIGGLCLYSYRKQEPRPAFLLGWAISWWMLPLCMTVGMLLRVDAFLWGSLYFLFSAFILMLAIHALIRYKRCHHAVQATCVALTTVITKGQGRYAPQFSFYFEGNEHIVTSFVFYPKRKCNRLFEVGHIYEIYINPQRPTDCADKRVFPSNPIGLLILAAFFGLMGVIVILAL